MTFTESTVEKAALGWLEAIGWRIAHGADIAPETPGAERTGYGDVCLARRLRDALSRLNPEITTDALEDAFRKLTQPEGADLIQRNRALHRLLVDGVPVKYRTVDGSVRGAQARVVDYEHPDANDWLAANQFTVSAGQHTRRADVVLFVNGLPLAVIELKSAAAETATIGSAWQQLQTYQAQVPALFEANAALVVSDGVEARIGALGAGKEWFKQWRTIAGHDIDDQGVDELSVLLRGVFEKRRFLDLLRCFIVFEDDGSGKLVKKIAGYHQYHAVQAAVDEALRAVAPKPTDRVAEQRTGYMSVKLRFRQLRRHGARAGCPDVARRTHADPFVGPDMVVLLAERIEPSLLCRHAAPEPCG